MKLFRSRLLMLAVGLLFLAGCGPDEATMSQTVVSQVAAAVSETVAAWPTPTLYPTQTPYDTATPYATYTPLATAVPPHTATPYPTYTPFPTYTTEPTATATAVPTNTSTPASQVTTSSAQPTTTQPPAVNQRDQLSTTLESVLRDIDIMRSTLRPIQTSGWAHNPNITILPTDCPTLIAGYDRVANILTLDTAASPPVIQNAYNTYRAGVEVVLDIFATRTDECRAFVTSGSTSTVMGQTEFNAVYNSLNEPIGWLNQAVNDLRQE